MQKKKRKHVEDGESEKNNKKLDGHEHKVQKVKPKLSSLNHFLSRLWCISAKCSISLLNDRLSFAPISGERLKKDRASVLNISSDAFPFLRLSLNQLRVSLFEGTRCSFTGRSILTDK